MQISLWTAQMFTAEETQIYINSVLAPLHHSSYETVKRPVWGTRAQTVKGGHGVKPYEICLGILFLYVFCYTQSSSQNCSLILSLQWNLKKLDLNMSKEETVGCI